MFPVTRRLLLSVLPLAALLWFATLSLAQLATPMPPFSIQAAIDTAPDGGTVNIPAGTYNESLTIGKNITLRGVSSATTAINAVPGQRVITVVGTHDLQLVELALSGGQAPSEVGGGIKLSGGSLFIDYCTLTGNSADYGGAIFQDLSSSRLRLTGSRVVNNSAAWDGGAIFARGEVALLQTEVLSNTAGRHGGGLHTEGNATRVIGGLFSNDRANGGNGGAMNINNGLTISGTRFVTNSAALAGGAVLQYNTGWSVTVSNALFEGNGATLQGGGLWANGNVTLTGSSLVSNTAITSGANTAGGGAYFGGASALVVSTTARGNEARCQNCVTPQGGGLAFSASTTGDVRGSSFEANYAWNGGGVSSNNNSTNLSVRDSIFTKNTGGYGAGISASSASIWNSQFLTNSVVNLGGAISVGGDLVVGQSRFAGNYASAGGGAVWSSGPMRAENTVFTANAAVWGGYALRVENPNSRTLTHLTFAQPGAASGEAIVVTAGTLDITNTIFASYTTGITVSAGAAVTANGPLWFNTATQMGGAGSFVATNESNGPPAFAADGYHLLAGSIAIDHGVASGVSTDIDGNARPWGAGYDIGAVEFPRHRIFLPVVKRQ